MVCHHSLLVSNVLGSSRIDRHALTDEQVADALTSGQHPRVVREVLEAFLSVHTDRLLESYHDALQARQPVLQQLCYPVLDHRRRCSGVNGGNRQNRRVDIRVFPQRQAIKGQDPEFLQWALQESQRRKPINAARRQASYLWGRYARQRHKHWQNC